MITIIVMLILAGVSLNAIVGDNGIITQAQSANIKNGMAVLEEYLQEKYVGEYDQIEDKAYILEYWIRVHPEMFYIPKNEGYGGLNYIESEGKSLYLIKKSGLPEDIREQLVGGEAGEGRYTDYASLNDVYGVTQKLKVYYCSSGINSITGMSIADVDDVVDREVFATENTGLGELLSNYDISGDGFISASEVKDIKSLEVTSNISLKDIYSLYALEKITIKDVSNIDISGIENLTKLNFIWFYNSSANDYSPIGMLGSKIKRLYFQHFKDVSVNKLVDDIKSYDLPNLQYLSFWNTGSYSHGPHTYMDISNRENFGQSSTGITSLSRLSELTQTTRNAVKYFYAEGNKLSNLEGIVSLPNLVILKIYGNSLTNLSGINNLTNLEYLQCSRNALVDSETREESLKPQDALYSISSCNKLKWLDISYNSNIVWISYLKNLPLSNLYMDSLTKISSTDMLALKDKINSIGSRTFDKKYTLSLMNASTTKVVDVSGQTLTVGDILNIGNCTNLTQLLMMNTKIVKNASESLASDEDTIEELMIKVFSKLTKINYLDIAGFTINLGDSNGEQKIKNLNFINSSLKSKLNWIDLRNTEVIAMGDNNTLNEADKAISISNANLLNTITTLRTFIVDTDKFDFYYMQDLVNRMSTGYRLISYYNAGGLTCFNNTSLKTLEKCDRITNINTFEYYGGINSDNVLDLSACNSLTSVHLFGWYGTVKCPSSIKNIGTTCTTTHFDFEDDGTDIILDSVVIDECGYGTWGTSIREFANSGVFVKSFNISAITGEGTLDVFLDSEGKCEWLESLSYSYANWCNPYDYSRFYNEFYKLIGSSITKISFSYSPVLNLDFLDGFEEQLTSITLNNSKIQNINKIKNFTNLTQLTLAGNYITSISSVDTLINLTSLNMSNNSIGSGIESLANLNNLEYLNLEGNNLYVDKYVNVGTGEAREEFITIFKNLHTNNKLKKLYLRSTNLQNIRNRLNVAPSWTELYCDS